MKNLCIIVSIIFHALLGITVSAQIPLSSPSPNVRLSAQFEQAFERSILSGTIDSAKRAEALAAFLKGQRQLWLASRQPTYVENLELRKAAKESLITALGKDPTLAEAYTILAELELTSQGQNIPEAVNLAGLAIRANPANFGGQRLRARIYTRLSNFTEPNIDLNRSANAIASWKEVVKLDPMNAEGWAFLSGLYEATGKRDLQIDALHKWIASPPSNDTGFYRGVIGRDAELTPETASTTLAFVLIKGKQTEEALDILTRLLIDNPRNRRAFELATEAVNLEPQANYSKIVSKLKSALSSNPGNQALILLVEKLNSPKM